MSRTIDVHPFVPLSVPHGIAGRRQAATCPKCCAPQVEQSCRYDDATDLVLFACSSCSYAYAREPGTLPRGKRPRTSALVADEAACGSEVE